jgi:alpha-methylacyl-CoA racemase
MRLRKSAPLCTAAADMADVQSGGSNTRSVLPLTGIRVLDFSTLLPGPMATLMMAEAGADVIKIERPPDGDGMRAYLPVVGGTSLMFAQLNRGKRSVVIDLKADGAVEQLLPLIRSADVLVEQSRPGVMQRLGLGYDILSKVNLKLIYCSITGYGQTGPKAHKAAHDLNYVAESGMLTLVAADGQSPTMPPTLVADIGAGAYPAIINVLLALQKRATSGRGCHIDISMNDHVLPFLYWAVGEGLGLQRWQRPGRELTTGGSPRYNIYRTADGRYLAAAPLEEQFWARFCDIIALAAELRDDRKDPEATREGVARAIAAQTTDYWESRFAGQDACVSIVATLKEALADPHYQARRVFAHSVDVDNTELPAAPVPLDRLFRTDQGSKGYAELGNANYLLRDPRA